MSFSIRRMHAERVRADTAALAEAEENLKDSVARRLKAQRVLDEAAREATILEELTQSLTDRLENSRRTLIGLCMADMPDDILRCIFEAVVDDKDDYETCTPFNLAAVCSRWRKVALASPVLWSTINSDDDSWTTADYSRVMLQLSRSGAAPLDIIAYRPSYTQHTPPRDVQVFVNILKALGRHASRWRTVTLDLPQTVEQGMIECLKGPTPLLAELDFSIHITNRDSVGPFERGYLPHAPNLRHLELMHTRCGCSTLSVFPALRDLRLLPSACAEEDLYIYLARAPSLVNLWIAITIAGAPRVPIFLPNLRTLHIGQASMPLLFQSSSGLIRMPGLSDLQLDDYSDDRIGPFLDVVSPTVRILRLHRGLTLQHLAIVRRLQNVDELHLGYQAIHPAALDQLAGSLESSDSPIWPRLSVLQELGYADGSGAHILRFVLSRNVGAATQSTGARPCKLREVRFLDHPGHHVPLWIVQEVNRVLGL
ncbi:hypothetical protein AURDEDRAFT_175338 [Auricularia subglabra TFB-10046 SS5]|nr:hypothetical protein AURDEDRAFT_175338 [Auricularia subglabra TFB-10046 SS5]